MARKHLNLELSEKIQKSFDGKEELTSQGDVFNDNLPETLTAEAVEATVDYIGDFFAAGLHATGVVGVQAMKSDKKLLKVSAEVPMGAVGTANYEIKRETSSTPPGFKEPVITKGVSTQHFDFVGGRNSGALAQAKTAIKELAAETLK